MSVLIKNAKIVDYSQTFMGDIYIEEGIIKEIGYSLDKSCEVLEAEGKTLMPSFVDSHVHFRDPGFTYKEDILSGSRAAVKGGYTAVNLMANTKPVVSSMEAVEYVLSKAEKYALIDAHQCVSITENFDGESLEHLDGITSAVRIISEDGKEVMDSKVMLEAMAKAKKKNITVMCHCEDHSLSSVDMRLAENYMTWRNIALAEFTGCRLHLAHVSTKEAIGYCIESKRRGSSITFEVTPHHLVLNKEINDYRVNPPIREEEDRQAIIKAIKEGYVDAIATDHAPHSKEDKEQGAPGLTGLETAFSLCYTELVRGGHITLNRLSELMSKRPAEIVGFKKGRIALGFHGDLVLVDLDKEYNINPEDFYSKGKNTPFKGYKVYGEILKTIKGGRIVYSKESGCSDN